MQISSETDRSLNVVYVGLIQQDEIWRTGDGRWMKPAEMTDKHLKNLLSYLEEMSYRYYDIIHHGVAPEHWVLSGEVGMPTCGSRDWMRQQPIYKAVKAELDDRQPKKKEALYTVCDSLGYEYPSGRPMQEIQSYFANSRMLTWEAGRFPVVIEKVQ